MIRRTSILSFFLVSAAASQGGQVAQAGQDAPASRPAGVMILEQLDRECRTLGDRLRKAYVSVTAERGGQDVIFSGTLLDGAGRVAVPASGVSGAVRIFARWEGRTFLAVKIFEDKLLPLAIIELTFNAKDPAPPAPTFAPRGSLGVGETVALVSNAFDFEGSVLFGSVSGTERVPALFPKSKLVQTTIGAVRGTPGGVVGNRSGEVAGILLGGSDLDGIPLSQIAREQAMQQANSPQSAAGILPQSNQNGIAPFQSRFARDLGFSLVAPIDQVRALLHDAAFLEGLKGVRAQVRPKGDPFVGVFLKEAIDELTRSQLRLEPGHGIVVDEVVEASPAKDAGLQRFDILLTAEGRSLRGTEAFRQCLSGAAEKGTLSVELLRGGARSNATIQLLR